MQVTNRRKLTMSGFYSDLSSTSDGLILFVVPVAAATVDAIEWGLDAGGTTSGGTSITVNRVRAETDALLTKAASTIANDASTLYVTIPRSGLQNNALSLGDIVRVDLDAVTGGTDSAGLTVTLVLNVERD